MRDHQGRPAGHQPPQRRQHPVTAVRVERRRGLVQHQHRGVAQHRPGDGDPLGLAAGQPSPAFADPGVVAIRQRGDELVRVRRHGRRADLLVGRVGASVGDVVADGAVDQQRLLEDDRDVPTQRGTGQVAQVVAVEEHPTGVGVEAAQDQTSKRRLARAARTDHGDHLARAQREGDVVERGDGLVGVPVADALDPDLAARSFQVHRAGSVGRHRRLGQQLDHPFSPGRGRVRRRHRAAEPADGSVETRQEGQEREQLTDTEGTARERQAPAPITASAPTSSMSSTVGE